MGVLSVMCRNYSNCRKLNIVKGKGGVGEPIGGCDQPWVFGSQNKGIKSVLNHYSPAQ